MNTHIKIYCKNIDEYVEIQGGQTLSDIYHKLSNRLKIVPICANVNNKTENLSFPIYAPKQVEFLDETSTAGYNIYIHSLCMILYKAVVETIHDVKLKIEHSVSNGYYCRLISKDDETFVITEEQVGLIKERMREISLHDYEFKREEMLSDDVRKIFESEGLKDKVLLMDTLHDLYTTFYRLGNTSDSYYMPLAFSSARIKVFDLIRYEDGMLLLGPDKKDISKPSAPIKQDKMYKAFTDYLKFNQVIRVSNIGELNIAVRQKRTAQLINVAEALHDKLLGRISDRITEINKNGGARIILLAGPSSSGKTTTTKRLAIQLATNLIVPKLISLDDYFVNRENTPRDESGDYDYESLYSLDLERLNSDLERLLRGDEINLPTYSFEFGQRIEKERPLKLEKNDVLLIEGIHGLNPELVSGIDPSKTFKIYISALTTLCIDDHNWISTTDNRLLRRIMRDNKYRHTPALETLRRWPSVRRGEEKWIFPYQENADAMFNSSLIFELGVMKDYVLPLLKSVPNDSPLYAEAYRLRTLLNFFESIPPSQIPTTSLLREFLGGSSFHY